MPDLFELMIMICAFLFGLCFGSFANVVIYRLPNKKSIIKPRSACPSCGNVLSAVELIPIFSWIFLRGKCRKCKEKISVRYLFVELLCGALFASMAYYSPTLSALPLMVFAFVLLTISFIDIDTMTIPDGLVIIGAVAGVIWVAGGHFFPDLFPYAQPWHSALIGAIAGAAPLFILDRVALMLLKKDGFGYGDMKLMAMVGLFIGWKLMLTAFLFAFLIAAVCVIYLAISGKAKIGAYAHFAFGQFLCIGTVLSLWFGEIVINWYIALIEIPPSII